MKQSLIKAAVRANGEGQLVFDLQYHGDGPVTLYWTTEPDKNSPERRLLKKVTDSPFTARRPVENRPLYYIAEAGGVRTIFGERTLPVEGMNNFRDLGGYIGDGGRRVKWGRLFRADHFHSVTPKGIEFLRELHIKTIIDYRSEKECNNNPNMNIGAEKTYHLDPDAHTAELAAQFSAEQKVENQALIDSVLKGKAKDEINGSGLQMLAQYRSFVTSDNAIRAFSKMLKVLADGRHAPLVQHCRGGKDRTGIGAMLVLGLLGVSREDIMADYMITKQNRYARNAVKLAEYKLLTDNQGLLDYLMSLVETRAEYLLESLRIIDNSCGGIETYARTVLSITQEEIDNLRNCYLE